MSNLEVLKDQIEDPQTAEYFEEVYKCYAVGCYRSAVVMLWTTTVADLIHKLERLVETTNDSIAKEILEYAQKKRGNGDLRWEEALVTSVKDKTELIDDFEHEALQSLKRLRNHCAHIVASSNGNLQSPNRETVLSHMVNCLEIVLTKPPLFSRAIVTLIFEELKSRHAIFNQDMSKFQDRMRNHYLRRLQKKSVPYLLKDFFKIATTSTEPDAIRDRRLLFEVFYLLYEKDPAQGDTFLRDPSRADTKFAPGAVEVFVQMLNEHPNLWFSIGTGAKDSFTLAISNIVDMQHKAYFLFDNGISYIEDLKESASNSDSIKLGTLLYGAYNYFNDVRSREAIIDFGLRCYGKSLNYDQADDIFYSFVQKFLPVLSSAQLDELLESHLRNDQCYRRRHGSDTETTIKEEIGSRFDPSADE